MIQRKQTLFLLIAVVLTIICVCLPLGSIMTDNGPLGETSIVYNLWITNADGSHSYMIWPLFAILLITCTISLTAIFSYRNRITQSRFCMFNMLLLFGWYVVFAVIVFYQGDAASQFKASLTSAIPAISIILHFMARKAILADEALVRSADRIR